MTLRQYLLLMGVATAVCWGALAVVVFKIDPYIAGTLAFVFFYFRFSWL